MYTSPCIDSLVRRARPRVNRPRHDVTWHAARGSGVRRRLPLSHRHRKPTVRYFSYSNSTRAFREIPSCTVSCSWQRNRYVTIAVLRLVARRVQTEYKRLSTEYKNTNPNLADSYVCGTRECSKVYRCESPPAHVSDDGLIGVHTNVVRNNRKI